MRLAQISHVQVLMSGWMPVALLMLHRFLASRSRKALAGFVGCFLLQAYSNGYYIYFLALAAGITVIVRLVALLLQRYELWTPASRTTEPP